MKHYGHFPLILVSDLGAGETKLDNLRLKHLDAIKGVFTGLATFINPFEIDKSPLWKQAEERKLEIYADSIQWYFINKRATAEADIRKLRNKGVTYFFLDDANLRAESVISDACDVINGLGGIPVMSSAILKAPQMNSIAAKYAAQSGFQMYRQDAGKDVSPVSNWLDDYAMTWADVECFKDDSGAMTTKEAFTGMMDIFIKHPKAPRNLRLYASDENTRLTSLAIWPTVLQKVKEWRKKFS